jgi:site-specific DNA-methyltransferase (adenine-specific)
VASDPHYTDIGQGRFYTGDCFDIMPSIADQVVNLVLCDLPYGATIFKWDSVLPLDQLWSQYRRVSAPGAAIVLTSSQPFTTTLIASNPEWFKYCWACEKSIAGDIFNAKNKPLRKHEDLCIFSSGTCANKSPRRMAYNPQGLTQIDRLNRNTETFRAFFSPRPSHKATYRQTQTGYPTGVLHFPNDVGLHPTQKPVALFEYLIKTYTNPGDLVLDNCAGSGTTAIACENTGRRWICIERDEGYAGAAIERIQQAVGNEINRGLAAASISF